MVAKTGGSDCYLGNSNVILDLSDTFSRTSRTNSNRTDPMFCLCSSRTELLRIFACSVRQLSNNGFVLFGLEKNKQNKLEPALFGKPSLDSGRLWRHESVQGMGFGFDKE